MIFNGKVWSRLRIEKPSIKGLRRVRNKMNDNKKKREDENRKTERENMEVEKDRRKM